MEGINIVSYSALINGIFVRKVNRFVCEVIVAGVVEQVHIKTTGRLAELLLEGADVLLEPVADTKAERKTRFSLIAVRGSSGWVNVDSQLPNKLMWDVLLHGEIKPFGAFDVLRKEVRLGRSRFDLYYERGEVRGFIEVKGVTLADSDVAKFPDAPSERASKHVAELIDVVTAGDEAAIIFVVQVPGCQVVEPFVDMDKKFAEVLHAAYLAGVRMLAYEVAMEGCEVRVVRELPVRV